MPFIKIYRLIVISALTFSSISVHANALDLLPIILVNHDEKGKDQQVQIKLKTKLKWLGQKRAEIEQLEQAKIGPYPIPFSASIPSDVTNIGEFSLAGFSQTKTMYAPVVPFYTIYLLGNMAGLKTQISLGKVQRYSNTFILPAAYKPCRCNDVQNLKQQENELLKLQEEFTKHYRSLKITSKNIPDHKWEYIGEFHQQALYRLLIYPTHFDASSTTVNYYPELGITLKNTQGPIQIHHDQNRQKYKKTLPILFMDWTSLASYLHQEQPKNILVVTPAKFKNTLLPYKKWKELQGYDLHFLFSDLLGSNPLDIKKSIQERFGKNYLAKFGNVILVGHEQSFPTFYKITSTENETPTDLPYFTQNDQDYMSDTIYGRFPTDNEGDLKRHIQKIIHFEQQVIQHTSQLQATTILGLASNEGKNPSDWEYMQKIQKNFQIAFPMKQESFHQDNPAETPELINQKLTSGLFWITYLGHGSGHSWDSFNQESFHESHLDQIQKMNSFPIVLDISCQNGRFLNDDHLGEKFMNLKSIANPHLPLGAVAYYGGSVNITWDPPALMAESISSMMARLKNSFRPSLGQILMSGQISLYSKLEQKVSIQENVVWYHLLGDPTLILPTDL